MAAQKSSAGSFLDEIRPIAVEWEGYGKLIVGQINLNPGARVISSQLPDNDGACTGDYKYLSKGKGIWNIRCTNDLKASGKFAAFGKNKSASGIGTDSNGRKGKYTISA